MEIEWYLRFDLSDGKNLIAASGSTCEVIKMITPEKYQFKVNGHEFTSDVFKGAVDYRLKKY